MIHIVVVRDYDERVSGWLQQRLGIRLPKKFDILKAYYQDEEEDMYWGQGQLEMIECIGVQNWLLQQM